MNLRRTLVVPVLGVLLVMLLAPASQAEPKRLLVGSGPTGPFRDNLGSPLFAGTGPLVPLDDVTRTFWVKNNSRQVARATVAVVNHGGSSDFERALTFGIDIDGVTASAGVPGAHEDGCRLVTTGPSIQPGQVQAVDVRLQVGDLAQRLGTDQTASVDFVVTLSQLGRQGQVEVCGAQATAEPTDGRGDHHQRCTNDVVVTASGTPTCVPTAVDAGRAAQDGEGPVRDPGVVGLAGAVLVGTGTALVLLRRRRHEDATQAQEADLVDGTTVNG